MTILYMILYTRDSSLLNIASCIAISVYVSVNLSYAVTHNDSGINHGDS